jgi:hypothetical protein
MRVVALARGGAAETLDKALDLRAMAHGTKPS